MLLSIKQLPLQLLCAGLIKLHHYSLQDGVLFLPASLTFSLHSTLSLMALHGMNIPMYGALKRCTPLVSLIFAVTLLKENELTTCSGFMF